MLIIFCCTQQHVALTFVSITLGWLWAGLWCSRCSRNKKWNDKIRETIPNQTCLTELWERGQSVRQTVSLASKSEQNITHMHTDMMKCGMPAQFTDHGGRIFQTIKHPPLKCGSVWPVSNQPNTFTWFICLHVFHLANSLLRNFFSMHTIFQYKLHAVLFVFQIDTSLRRIT